MLALVPAIDPNLSDRVSATDLSASPRTVIDGVQKLSALEICDTLERTIMSDIKLASIEEALEAFKQGEFLVVVDDLDRENEGDLIIAASAITTQKMAWLIKHSSGYICTCLTGDRLDQLQIPLMVPDNKDRHRTAYTHTVDYKNGKVTKLLKEEVVRADW